MENKTTFYPHLSVDCVLIGFDGTDLKVLLVERSNIPKSPDYHDMKLPGRLIYEGEDLDDAANSVLSEVIKNKRPYIRQFKTFGSPMRTSNPKDVLWLENAVKLKIGRLVTVAYMALIRIDGKISLDLGKYQGHWISLSQLPVLAFDHNQIIDEAREHIMQMAKLEPRSLFELMPPKFTALQLRRLYELVYQKPMDVRNFHKKITSLPYIVPLDEREKNVSHRAARYYKFDKKKCLTV